MDEQYENDQQTDSFGQFEPAGGQRGSLLSSLRGRLGDVRIHSNSLAEELTRRLGARAFTMGRDVYVRPELLRAGDAQSQALLAHELFHVGEQTGANVDMPL